MASSHAYVRHQADQKHAALKAEVARLSAAVTKACGAQRPRAGRAAESHRHACAQSRLSQARDASVVAACKANGAYRGRMYMCAADSLVGRSWSSA